MTNDGRPTSVRESLLDLLVYAPIGLALDAEELAPDLARRGRNHAAAARRIGEFAVLAGRRRIEQAMARLGEEAPAEPSRSASSATVVVADDVDHDEATPATSSTAAAVDSDADPVDGSAIAAGPGEDATGPAPSAEELAIPEYDLLAASQVVKRLDALTGEQLEAVRVYEESTRGRRTILHKIARLQA